MDHPLIVSWGGGVNSTAIVVEMKRRGVTPDCILFADTQAEKPETYAFRDLFDRWLAAVEMPLTTRVQSASMYPSLEAECLTKKTMPSIVFGFRSCSDKYKLRPQKEYLKRRYGKLEGLTLAIGYGFDERRRAENAARAPEKYARIYPLIEWRWGREECIDAIQAAGLPIPVKSACFFCPSSTKLDVRRLAREHPELAERALAMERDATAATTAKGLGRHWSWREVIAADERVLSVMPPDTVSAACGCWDGGDE